MITTKILRALCIGLLLAAANNASAATDTRVASAAERQDWTAVNALLKQRADVNTAQA